MNNKTIAWHVLRSSDGQGDVLRMDGFIMRQFPPILCLLVVFSVHGAPPAEPPVLPVSGGRTRNPDARFAALDKDADGALTPAEFDRSRDEMAERRFRHIDGDHDGSVTKNEFDEARGSSRGRSVAGEMAARGHAPKRFADFDGDGNGLINLEEFTGALAIGAHERFQRLDRDEGGAISRREFENAGRRQRPGHEKAEPRPENE